MNNIKQLLTTYLSDIRFVRGTGKGTDERSYYPALAALLGHVGANLTPRVKALHDVKDRGVGHPDFLLEVETTGDTRAAVEVKGTTPEVDAILNSEQVRRYLSQYGLTLVTNLREFVLVQLKGKRPDVIMRYALADNEANFWNASATAIANQHSDQFRDFLINVMTWDAPIKRPVDLAEALARYARETLRRLELQPSVALDPLRKALAEALGLQFTDADGEHFFRSSLVQTLFYGLFSAWVAYQRQGGGDSFRWREAGDYLGLPLVRELFERIAIPSQLETLDIRKPLEWAEQTLIRTDWEPFEQAFEAGSAINYFYEPFLEAFDPALRKDLGVWYTPPEIVRYMVARVDAVLREELGEADGLASPNVYILDPCCGTGAYLLETLRRIADILRERGEDALLAAELKKAAMQRVFGFEIMPAPFVVAQLQIGLLLSDMGAPLKGKDRAGVFLTNALTGWETHRQLTLEGFPELKHEAEAVASVKQDVPILVILGNPPYNGFAGTAVAQERTLTDAYRTTKRAPRPQGQGLNDLYVRFFRMAERRIVDKTGKGVVCFISNYSWLDGLSHTGMRERYLEAFDKIWIDNLHGDRVVSEYAPDGRTSETVFAVHGTSPGIRIGTAISLFARNQAHSEDVVNVMYADFDQARADERRQALLSSLDSPTYTPLLPVPEIGLPFKPRILSADYLSWPRLPEMFPVSFPGVKTSRDDVVVDIDKDRLIARMEKYFDPAVSHEQMRDIAPGAMEDSADFQARETRDYLRNRGFLSENVVRYCYRPFDVRWIYWEPETKLLDRNRADYIPHVFAENVWIVSQQKPRRDWSVPQVINSIGCLDLMDRGATCFPLWQKSVNQHSLKGFGVGVSEGEYTFNLSFAAFMQLGDVSISEPGTVTSSIGKNIANPRLPFYHTISILHSPAYLSENAGALRQDWPRIPIPLSKDALSSSALLGQRVAELLNSEKPMSGVTSGQIRDELKGIGTIMRVGGGQLNPDTDFAVRARWGYAGRGGITMPGQGRVVERDIAAGEFEGLGTRTVDVYLNDVAYWRNIPLRVWEYTIGGYQVIKKWLSYREFDLLKRPLTLDEVREVTNIARRIASLLLLEPQLDANYEAVKAQAVTLK